MTLVTKSDMLIEIVNCNGVMIPMGTLHALNYSLYLQ